jgi:hypothetical protein
MKNPDSNPTNGDNGAPKEGIGQVRELIVGNQIREIESRFGLTEERIVKETVEMRDDIRRRFDTLEHFIKHEAGALNGRVGDESKHRKEADQRLGEESKQNISRIEERLARLEEQSAARDHELRQLILDECKKLSEEIRQKHEDVTTQLRNESRQLRAAKTDRSTLASLLTDMALRLDGPPPSEDEKKA